MSDHGSNEKAARARHIEAGPEDIRQVLEIDGHTAKVLHADGTVDLMDTAALGGELEAMPAGYYRSPQFIGTVVVSFLFYLRSCRVK
jgi:tetraacyldisaccharide-1-P 4'-kinase